MPAPSLSNCSIFFNETNAVFAYDFETNTSIDITLYFNTPPVNSDDIAVTTTKLWMYNGLNIQEYNIILSPFSGTSSRNITLPDYIGAGLTSINDTTLISSSYFEETIIEINVSSSTAVFTTKFPMPPGRNIAGDMVLTTSNKLICTYGSSSGNYLTQHDYNTGDIEVDILLDTDIYGPYGIFTLLGEIYVCNGDGKIYNLSTSEPYTLNYIQTAPNGVYGSSQSPECSTVTFDYCSPTYYICNTDIPGADDSYLNAGTYNDRQYYSGETDEWVIYFYTGTTSSYWCLSDTLGGSCYLTGKSPCTSECPDLCDDYLSVKPCCPNNLVVNGQFTSNLDGWDNSFPSDNWIWDSSFNGSALYYGTDEGGNLSQDILTINHEYDITIDLNFVSGSSICTTIKVYAGTNEYNYILTEGDLSIDISLTCVGNTIFNIYALYPCETGNVLHITNVCVTDVTPVVDCDILDFTALFDCEYMPTPTPTPTSTLTPTPTPSTASNYCSTVGVDAVVTINQLTPTPTPTPTSTSSSIVRDCSFSGDVIWNITQGNILCPFNQEFKDCVNGEMYYVNIVTGLNITPSKDEVFKAIVNGVSKCISYVGIDFNNSPSGTIEITNGPFGSLETGCENCKIFIPPSPTPTPTMTMTPTPTNSTPPTLCFEYIGDGPNILYQCSVQAQPTLYNDRYYWVLDGCPTDSYGFYIECPTINNNNYIWWDNFEWNHSSSLGGGTIFTKLSNPGLLPIEILGTYEWVSEMVGTCAPEIRNSFSGPCVPLTLTPTPTPTPTPTNTVTPTPTNTPTNGCNITSSIVLAQGTSSVDACTNFGTLANRDTYYTFDGSNFATTDGLNQTPFCTQRASSGWYSDGIISRYFNNPTGIFNVPVSCV